MLLRAWPSGNGVDLAVQAHQAGYPTVVQYITRSGTPLPGGGTTTWAAFQTLADSNFVQLTAACPDLRIPTKSVTT